MKGEARFKFIFWSMVLLPLFAAAQSDLLDRYIEIGLQNNLALKQQEFSLQRSLQALEEARGMFLPSISIEARYSRAGGGRVIDIPIGDMVNPIHYTLNQLLMLHGFDPSFPVNIPNEQVPFLREQEHDTKLRLIQPLFQPALYHNMRIKKDLSGIEEARLNVYKRQLVTDIKGSYFTYLKALKIETLLEDTRKLLEENLRLSESLFRNHKVTEDVVFHSRAEISNLDQQQAEAGKNTRLAAAHFNFLLNRPLKTEIEIGKEDEEFRQKVYDLEGLINQALLHRAEFRQLQGAIAAARHTVGLHKSSLLPTVSAVLDYGFQGEEYRFSRDDDYWMGSLLLNWNLFRGGQDAARQRQALLEKRRLEAQQEELEHQIRLQVKEAYYDLEVASRAIVSTENTLKSREQAFFIVSRKYQEGMVPQIEYTKAQNDYTSARLNHIIAIYDYYIKEAQLEQAAALNNFQ